MLGRKHNEKTLKIMSDCKLGNKNPMYGKKGKDNPLYGIPKSKEHIRKVSEAKKGKHLSNNAKQKLLLSRKRGENHQNALLTNNEVLSIVRLYNNGMKQKDIAKIFNVNKSVIQNICSGRTWSSITGIKYTPKKLIGENNPTSKLTSEQVLEIVKLHNQGYSYGEIAKIFGVSRSLPRHICIGLRWSHITGIIYTK